MLLLEGRSTSGGHNCVGARGFSAYLRCTVKGDSTELRELGANPPRLRTSWVDERHAGECCDVFYDGLIRARTGQALLDPCLLSLQLIKLFGCAGLTSDLSCAACSFRPEHSGL